eukprot:scaffold1928_cov103-Isochrysis_galbana.AAC.1
MREVQLRNLISEPDPAAPRRYLKARPQARGCRTPARQLAEYPLRRRVGGGWQGGRDGLGAGGHVADRVTVEHEHAVGRLEEVARAAHDHNSRHFTLLPQRSHAGHERPNRLAVGRDQPCHPLVPDDEVGRAGVLIEQQRRAPGLQRLHDAGGLRGGARRVCSREVGRASAKRKVVDERRDVGAGDGPAVLGPDFDRVRVGHHKLAAVSGHLRPEGGA